MFETTDKWIQSKVALSPKDAIRNGSKTFAFASFFLPDQSRKEALVLYQWLRNCDDFIDEAGTYELASARFKIIENARRDQHPLAGPKWVDGNYRTEFIKGLGMDIDNLHYQSLTDLTLYCFRVAGIVGLMMCPLLGANPRYAPPHAAALGIAMQITNIARDIQTDANLGRIYVPRDLLSNVDATKLAAEPELALVAVKRMLKAADSWYEFGLRGLAFLPLRTGIAIAVAALVYRQIGHKILALARKNPAMAFRSRAVVSPLEKVLLVGPACLVLVKAHFARILGHRNPRPQMSHN